jgi:hypothetical protein
MLCGLRADFYLQISTGAIHCNVERGAHFVHPCATEPTEAVHEYRNRDALNGVEIQRASPWNRIFLGLEHDFAEETADHRCARCDEGSAKPRDGNVTGEDDDRPTTDIRKLAPPHFPS